MRLMIAEDGLLFREGLAMLLEARGHEVVEIVDNADDLVSSALRCKPDVAIADIRMPSTTGQDGAKVANRLREALPECGILLLSQHVELRNCLELIGTPGFGYLLKDRILDLEDFDDALGRLRRGGSVLDPEVVRALVEESGLSALRALTAREHEVLSRVAEGLSNTAISRLLHVSERTVESHMRSIFWKLDLHDDASTHRRVLAVTTYLSDRANRSGGF